MGSGSFLRFIRIPDKTIKSFYQGRVSGPGGVAARNVVNPFPVRRRRGGAAIKNFLKFFIRKQYYLPSRNRLPSFMKLEKLYSTATLSMPFSDAYFLMLFRLSRGSSRWISENRSVRNGARESE